MMRSLRSLILGISGLTVFVAAAHAQEGTITVTGNVTDPSGAYVSAAQVQIKLKQCKCSDCKDPEACDCCPNQLTTQTNEVGHYSFSVPHGIYLLDVRAEQREARLELDLNNGTERTQDIHLE